MAYMENWMNPKKGEQVLGEVYFQGYMTKKGDDLLIATWNRRWFKLIVNWRQQKRWLLYFEMKEKSLRDKTDEEVLNEVRERALNVIPSMTQGLTDEEIQALEQHIQRQILTLKGVIPLDEIKEIRANSKDGPSKIKGSGFDLIPFNPKGRTWRLWQTQEEILSDPGGWIDVISAFKGNFQSHFNVNALLQGAEGLQPRRMPGGRAPNPPPQANIPASRGNFLLQPQLPVNAPLQAAEGVQQGSRMSDGLVTEMKYNPFSVRTIIFDIQGPMIVVPDVQQANHPVAIAEKVDKLRPFHSFGPHSFVVSLLVDKNRPGDKSYLVTKTSARGSFGKFRVSMRLEGSDELLGVKELRLQARRISDPNIKKTKETAASHSQSVDDEVKLMKRLKSKVKVIDTVLHERQALNQLNSLQTFSKVYVVMTLMYPLEEIGKELGEEKDMSKKRSFGRKVLWDVAQDIRNCHAQNYVHCDVKPANIFIVPDGSAALADYGITVERNKPRGYTSFYLAPRIWCAPYMNGDTLFADPSSDVYALAMSWAYIMFPGPGKVFVKMWIDQIVSAYPDRSGTSWAQDLQEMGPLPEMKNAIEGWAQLRSTDSEVFDFLWQRVIHCKPQNCCSIDDLIQFLETNPEDLDRGKEELMSTVNGSELMKRNKKMQQLLTAVRMKGRSWWHGN